MTTAPTACRCGTTLDNRGLCAHCDAQPPIQRYVTTNGVRSPIYACPPLCPPCNRRDSYCPVCHTDCGSPAAAIHHDKQCRKAENYLRNDHA